MPIVGIIVLIIFAALVLGGIVWLVYFLRNKEAADLSRYLQGESCQWQRLTQAAAGGLGETVYFVNGATESQGIEMRVYADAGPGDGSRGDNDDVCLSIIDVAKRNGMILNGFARLQDAMEFGDGLWNERFLGDAGIMEELIAQKRVDWDQMQQDIIIGPYGMFM